MQQLTELEPAWVSLPLADDEEPARSDDRAVAVGVHLAGSVPLANAEDVFRRVTRSLGDRLRRIPDGETGPRSASGAPGPRER